jgi:hypothetical protein
MSYEVMYRLRCDWRNPETDLSCMAQFQGTADDALRLGWILGEESELCPPHGIAHLPTPSPGPLEDLPPAAVTVLQSRPDFIFVPPPVVRTGDLPERDDPEGEIDDENTVLAGLPGTARLMDDLTTSEEDEGEPRGESWAARNLRRVARSRMAGRHASPARKAARDRAVLDPSG